METFSEFKENNPDSNQKIVERPLPHADHNQSTLNRYSNSQFQSYLENPFFKLCIVLVLLALVGGYFYGKTSKTRSTVSNPIVTPTTTSNTETKPSKSIKVYVAGAVVSPGVVEVDENSRVADAVAIAGGPNENANLLYCDMAAFITDGETIIVPEIGLTGVITCKQNNINSTGSSGTTNSGQPFSKISLNNSTQVELETLPGVGPSLAKSIISYRESNGGYKNIADLKKVKGIGDKRFADLKDLVSL